MTMKELNNHKAFEELTSKGIVVVDFTANRCTPCKMMYNNIKTVDGGYGERVLFLKVDVNKYSNIAKRFKVKYIPKLIFFKEGRIISTSIGTISTQELRDYVEEAMNASN